eukprot:scaffold806_cov229-Pinguiococcus_pyrenoidosus.AAC.9
MAGSPVLASTRRFFTAVTSTSKSAFFTRNRMRRIDTALASGSRRRFSTARSTCSWSSRGTETLCSAMGHGRRERRAASPGRGSLIRQV